MKSYFILILGFFLIITGCDNRNEKDFIKALLLLDKSGGSYTDIDPGIKEEIEEIVHMFKDSLEQEVSDYEDLDLYYKRLGSKYLELAQIYREIRTRLDQPGPDFKSAREEEIYNKMRAIRYYDNAMYGKAYESFNRAIELDPGNSILYYNAGVCAGWIAKSKGEPVPGSEGEKWFRQSEWCYKRALELYPYYVDALYGYSVLLVIELNRPEEGIKLLDKILTKEKKNIKALFLLARAYYQAGDYEKSLDTYDRILDITMSAEVKEKVRDLKEQVKESYYGSE